MGMAKSVEYPDLPWVSPAAYGSGRDGKAVRYIVIHYTAGSERASSAEDGAAYDARRTDGTSTHYFVDQDSVVQCVRTSDRANAARARGNRLGIQYELCGTQQTRAQWLDVASRATLQITARQVARDCAKYDIPARRLTVAETRRAWTEFPSGPRGIVGHVDCTQAYPEDGGDHTDPGTDFPWDVFLQMVRDEMSGDEMTKAEFLALLKDTDVRVALATGVWQTDGVIKAPPTASPNADGTPNTYWSASSFINGAYVGVGNIRADISRLNTAVATGFSTVMAQLKAEGGIPAGASAEEIATLVVTAMAARLQA